MSDDIRVRHHVDLYKVCRHCLPKLIGDGEGNGVVPNVVDKFFWQLEWHHSLSWHWTHVRGWLSQIISRPLLIGDDYKGKG